MTLEAIILEILESTAVKTLSELAVLVGAHHAYQGKSRGSVLENRIARILQDERFRQSIQTHGSYVELKLGPLTGRIDLS